MAKKNAAAKKAAKKQNPNISYINMASISVEDGNKVMAQAVAMLNDLKAKHESSDQVYSQFRKHGVVSFQDVKVRPGVQMVRMFAENLELKCACCGKPVDSYLVYAQRKMYDFNSTAPFCITPMIDGQFASCDHVFPRSLGGRDVVKNMQIMCQSCNSCKGTIMTQSDLEFIQTRIDVIIDKTKMFEAMKAVVAEYKKKKKKFDSQPKNHNGAIRGFISAGQVNAALREVENLRGIITTLHSNGVSMVELSSQKQTETAIAEHA